MKLIIVRHGETDRNKTDHDETAVHPGPIDNELNDRGQRQVQAAAQRLAEEKIDCIYSSDLLRAKQTTAAIAAYHPDAQVIFDPQLRERDAGVFAGQPDVTRKAAQQASGVSLRDWKPEGGESLREVKVRAGAWYAQHCQHDPTRTVVVVSHGIFLSLLMEWALEDGADVEKEAYRHHNAAVTILDIPPHGRAVPILLNDTSHLA